MKKNFYVFVILLASVFFICACNTNLDNTPTKKVEAFLTDYQTLNSGVIDDLNTTLDKDIDLDEKTKNDYREFMKRHYQDLTYEIKNETIDGNNAAVEVAITVRDYSKVVTNAESYRIDNNDQFLDENGNYDVSIFTKYRMDKLKKVKEKSTYTIIFDLKKQNDEWILEQLSKEDMNKINGLYIS